MALPAFDCSNSRDDNTHLLGSRAVSVRGTALDGLGAPGSEMVLVFQLSCRKACVLIVHQRHHI